MNAAEIQNRKKQVKQFAMDYAIHRYAGKIVNRKGKVKLHSIEENGIEFYAVGHNASHEFYLGVDDEGNYWKCSFGETWLEGNESDRPDSERRLTKLGDSLENEYFGHY